jgi:hypothetical protein
VVAPTAPPDIPLGDAIVPIQTANNVPVQATTATVDIDGVIWEHKQQVAVDVMTDCPRQPKLQWSRTHRNTEATDQRDIFDCFRLFFPEQCIQTILDLTNHNMSTDIESWWITTTW